MAPIPPNATARIFVDYITGNGATAQEHTLAVRYAPSATPQSAQTALAVVLNAIGASVMRQGWRVLGVRNQPLGSDFTVPVDVVSQLSSFVGTSTSAWPASNEALELRWVGRDYLYGRKVSFSLFGVGVAVPDNYRFPVGGSSPAWVGSTVSALNTYTDTFVSIAGNPATWYSYVNAQFNSYWEDRLRG